MSKITLKKLIKQLAAIKGRHTELVTVYVPAGYSLTEIANQLRNEQGTSENIKSKQVRKNVTSALDKIVRNLALYKRTPENGMAIFCGNVSEKEGAADLQIWTIEPPEPIRTKLYWCDQKFVTEPLEDMIAEKEIYGIINLDKGEATIALLKGKRLETVFSEESIVPGKSRAGGQCLHESTDVATKNGSKSIRDIKEGDIILSYDFSSKRILESPVKKVMRRKCKEAFVLSLKNTHLLATKEHLIFTPAGEKYAEDINFNDTVFVMNGGSIKKMKIAEKDKISLQSFYFDLVVPPHENFFANGIIVHNSSQRFSRIREGLLNDWLKKVGEAANKIFGEHKVLGILLSGGGPVKEMLYKEDYMHADVKNKILGLVDTSYTGDQGLEETIIRGEHLIKEAGVIKEKKMLQRFLEELQKPSGLAVYGLEKTLKIIEMGAAETILAAEDLAVKYASYDCACGRKYKLVKDDEKKKQICGQCNAPQTLVEEKDALDALEDLAENYGTKFVVVSIDTREGKQFEALGGVGAFLRYRI